jgi:hypothetical protein
LKRIQNSISQLPRAFPSDIEKPAPGLYTKVGPRPGQETPTTPSRREEDIYGPFADWLKNDLEEVTAAASLGGAMMRTKWGTPDVVGIYRPSAGSVVRFQPEIVAAEIKIDGSQTITAFGQAVAYRLFAAKSFMVMPSTMGIDDSSRLEALAMHFGIGLVLFDPSEVAPRFSIRVRAQRFVPDMYYVNEFADRLRTSDPEMFNSLFG